MKRRFKLILILLISILYISNISASTKTYERTDKNNYGVKKEILLNDNNIDNAKNTKLVDASEKIYDFSNILTDEEEKKLKEYIDNFTETTDMDMVILTDRLPYYDDQTNATYATDFYDYNDFGMDYDKYSGVILFRNTYEEDPYYNVYTTGNAQLYFTYNRCEDTLDDIYDYFVSKDYLNGIKIFINEFTNYYEKGIPSDYKDAYIDDYGFVVIPKTYYPPFILALIIGGIISGISTGIMVSKNKMVYKAKGASEYLNKQTIHYNKNECKLESSHTTSHYIPPSSSSGSGGSHSHSFGGSSGIGHGGGGGRHG